LPKNTEIPTRGRNKRNQQTSKNKTNSKKKQNKTKQNKSNKSNNNNSLSSKMEQEFPSYPQVGNKQTETEGKTTEYIFLILNFKKKKLDVHHILSFID